MVVLTHVAERLDVMPGMGLPDSPGHYLDLTSGVSGIGLFSGRWPRAFFCSSSERRIDVCPGQGQGAACCHHTERAAHGCRSDDRVPVPGPLRVPRVSHLSFDILRGLIELLRNAMEYILQFGLPRSFGEFPRMPRFLAIMRSVIHDLTTPPIGKPFPVRSASVFAT